MNSTINVGTGAFGSETVEQLSMNAMLADVQWQAVLARDAASDAKFVFAVSSTGVYCRPSCPSKRPRRENVSFFDRPQQAEADGFCSCLRCRPKLMSRNSAQE